MSWDFTEQEWELVEEVRPLFQSWGYRILPGNMHANFEAETHHVDGGRFLQYYTDPLFRNLQQNRPKIFQSDTKMVRYAAETDMSEYPEAVEIIKKFLTNKRNMRRMKRLKNQTLRTRSSLAFRVLVHTARALICLKQQKFDQAQIWMETLADRIDRLSQ